MLWLLISVLALCLGLISAGIGWMGYGSIIFGVPAVILAIIAMLKRKNYKNIILIFSILAIILVTIGIIETIIMSVIVSGLQEVVSDINTTSNIIGNHTSTPISVTHVAHPKFLVKGYRASIRDRATITLNFDANFNGFAYLYNGKEQLDKKVLLKEEHTVYLQAAPYGCNFEPGNYTIQITSENGKVIDTVNLSVSAPQLEIKDIKITTGSTCSALWCDIKRISLDVENHGNVPVLVKEIELNVNGDIKSIPKEFVVSPSSSQTIVIYDPLISVEKGDEIKEVVLNDDCGEVTSKEVNYLIV